MKRTLSLVIAFIMVLAICSTAMAAVDPILFIEGTVTRTSSLRHSASCGDDVYGSIKLTALVPRNGATGATFRGQWGGYNVTPGMTFRLNSTNDIRYTYTNVTGFGPGSIISLYGSTPDANDGTTSYRGDWTR